MAKRNLGYDVEVDYTGAQAAQSAIGDLDRFNTELDKVDHAAKEVGESTGGMFKKATSSWTEFRSAMDVVTQGFNTAKAAAAQMWETINRGADLDRITGHAEALAADIGTSWKVLLADMTESTGGMITQADLTASAVDIIGLGMADTGEEVTRLSRLVGELGWDMQTLTLTLANQSKARLDSLGLSVGDVTKRVEKFKDAGVEAEQAFKLAVLEAGEERLELLGSAADTAAGDLKKLEATWGDLMDRIAQGASEASAPLATIILSELQIADAIEKGIISQRDMSLAQAEAIFTNKTMAESLSELAAEVGEVEDAERRTSKYYSIITQQRIEMTQAAIDEAAAIAETTAFEEIRRQEARGSKEEIRSATEAYEQQRQIGYDIVAGYIAAGEGVSAIAAHQQLAADTAEAWAENVAAIQAASGDAFTSAAFDPEMAYDAATATYQWADSLGAGAGALSDMGQSLGLVTAEQAEYALTVSQSETITRSLAEAAASGAISWQEYELAVGNARRILEQGPPRAVDKWDATAFFEAGGDDIKGRVSPIVEAIDEAVGEARNIVDGFISPDEAYEAVMDMDITAVEEGTVNAINLLNSIEDKVVTVTFAAVGYDDLQDKLDEIQ